MKAGDSMSETENKCIKPFIPWVDALAEAFGNHCEVVLHDLRNLDKSIVKIANGHITGRKVGAPITDMGLRLFEEDKKNGKKNSAVVGYRTRTKDGRELKSTTLFIRDQKGNAVGCLCINIDLTPYLTAKNFFDQICRAANPPENVEGEADSPERFVSDVDTLIGQLIEKALQASNRPVIAMSKEDKLQVMKDLKKNGFFLIKGAVKRLAGEWGVSIPTIYKYLEEI
jgi:predicted transcriptional regulator YheO